MFHSSFQNRWSFLFINATSMYVSMNQCLSCQLRTNGQSTSQFVAWEHMRNSPGLLSQSSSMYTAKPSLLTTVAISLVGPLESSFNSLILILIWSLEYWRHITVIPVDDGRCLPYVFQAQLTSTTAACWAAETARWQYLWKMKSECHLSWEGRSTRQDPSHWLCAKSVSGQEIIQGNTHTSAAMLLNCDAFLPHKK